ncbi:MBL fold metallo-hydrolase [Bacillus salacetis]|uniref:MBL fold metallo-hydrolase n=1 Tax=Bacillus salacetis TaxID=2315464 RepID=UPI003B9E0282
MGYLLENVKENLFVLAIWDTDWSSYNNCYILLEKESVILVDSCKKQHIPLLEQALNDLGKSPQDVKLVLATHGHEDHVEGAAIFTNARKLINPREELDDMLGFEPVLLDQGTIQGFDYELVEHHSPGSVVFYHEDSKTVFMGDFLCFFGDPLSKGGLVSEGEDLRKAWMDFLEDGGVPEAVLPGFLNGLKKIHDYDAEVMCTGHGGVLVGEIKDFIAELVRVGELNSSYIEQG